MKKRKLKRVPDDVSTNDLAEVDPAIQDQRERGYYYDDAHGYQKYSPKKDVPEDDAEESKQTG